MLNANTIHQRLQQRGNLDADKVSPLFLQIASLLEMIANASGALASGLLDDWEEERIVRAVDEAKETLRRALDGSE